MREQTGQGTRDIIAQPRHSTGTHAGLYPDDVPYSTNERRRPMADLGLIESQHTPSSTRRYPTSQTSATEPTRRQIHMIRHGPAVPRASRLPVPVPRSDSHAPKTKIRLPWWAYLALVVLVMVLGSIGANILFNVIHTISDNLTYGNPRTSQTDKDVGHGGVSHFTVENLGGHIIVIEVVNNDPSRVKVYAILTIDGDHADLAPATLSFEDRDGNGLLDMIVHVNESRYIWPNDGKTFQQDKGGSSS
jgi:hypothetical protein